MRMTFHIFVFQKVTFPGFLIICCNTVVILTLQAMELILSSCDCNITNINGPDVINTTSTAID